ncbi:esterase/lipase family protein [Lentzea rhizosphaerae]|uniref:Esterase/lipase family protein n=1 Tax=Lentzea rhizosphaerae TaxID=2041025 RepID=A0ABV8C3W3_9PSEU
MSDLVVVLPGILGSTLRDEDGMVWEVSAKAAVRAVLTLGRHLHGLKLPDGIGDEHPGDGIQPVALMADLHVIPGIWTPLKGYDRVTRRMNSLGYTVEKGNLLLFAYDWRLSNRYNGALLARRVDEALDKLGPNAKVSFVCHSMGGLVARWCIEQCGMAERTDKLITMGTPYRGAAAALEQLVNGVRKGLGPLAIDLTEFARSMPSLHQLLPEYACIESASGLVKTTETTLPELDTKMVEDAMAFHGSLSDSFADRTYAIIGGKQPTATTARIADGKVTCLRTYEGDELYGDATVPMVGAARRGLALSSNTLHRVTEQHTSLQDNAAVLDAVESFLTSKEIVPRNVTATEPQVSVPDLVLAGEDLAVTVELKDTTPRALKVAVLDENGRQVESRSPAISETMAIKFDGLTPGAYYVQVSGISVGAPVVPVTSAVLVMDCPSP